MSSNDAILGSCCGTCGQIVGIDSRTGVLNWEAWERRAKRLLDKTFGPVALLFCDVDNFKTVNDTLGHQTGDSLLRSIAFGIQQVTRLNDLVGRYGGDEFVALLLGDDNGTAVAHRILQQLRRVSVCPPGTEHEDLISSASVSIGVATRTISELTSLDDLIQRADSAMYQAKHAGGNQVAPTPDRPTQTREARPQQVHQKI
ncbi:GGDEF domain-containing protein [Sciscionella marina]|uniref:GGDEF domain-containing protein n=1 Tax=Sciscionella marina TaxID=508770 RepID=UPI0009FBC38E|nr:GGDEF domain-containing protein [Sciscionella marina]